MEKVSSFMLLGDCGSETLKEEEDSSFMNFGTETVDGNAGNQMEWSVNNAIKTIKDLEPNSMMDIAIIPSIEPADIRLNSSEKGNYTLTMKPRKKTMTSIYLKFFETAADGKSRRCMFCGQNYSIATATGNLGRHLSNRHPGYDKSGDAVTSAASQSVTVAKKSQRQAKSPHVDFDHLNWLLLKWLILASLPPSTLEEKWLSNSFKFLHPSIKLWPGEKYHAVLREVYRSMREDVKLLLEQFSSMISITLNFWTSYEQIFYMSVTCQWIDLNWSSQKVLLDICRIPYPGGAAEIYHCLVAVLKMYNIESRVISCTHDNSANGIHALHILKDDMDGKKVGPFCYIPCAAHTLNAIIDDGLKVTKPIISKIREFVLEMNASSEISEEFVQLTTFYQEVSWKFPLDASSRWSGSYQMLDIVDKADKSMDAVIRKNTNALDTKLLLSIAEKHAVNHVHAFLEPFFKTTNNICTNKVPTIGLVLFFMDNISEMITVCKDSRHQLDWLKNAAEEMAKKDQSYSSQVCNIFIYMTAILDPRIKVDLIPDSVNSENYLEEARIHFMRNYATHFSSINNGYNNVQEIEDAKNVSFAEEIAKKKRRASMSTTTDELTQYLSEPLAPIPTDVLEWWKVNSTRYPRLSVMARDFLAVQATSVPPEEVFCSKGDEIDKQRFCLSYDITQAILCIRSWTQGGIRLKYKSTEIDYERLMELAAVSVDNKHCRF